LLLLCSDGLTRHVDDGEIAAELGRDRPAAAAETLVRLARERGGEDNITVAIVRHGSPAESAPLPQTLVDDQPTLTVARPRPQPVTPVRIASPAPAIEAGPRLWPLVFVLAAVMMILIFALWMFIQGTLII
jgi:protein phosphatase